MKIANVQLKNIACFEDLALDFVSEETDEPAPWVILLGENGTGKSTLLQMIGATLLTWPDRAVIAGNVNWELYIPEPRHILTISQCRIALVAGPGDEKRQSESVNEIAFSLPYGEQDYRSERPPFSREVTGGWFSCGYGTTRQISGLPATHRGSIPIRNNSYKPYRFTSLFGNISGMTDVPDWLAGLYFQASHEQRTDEDQRRFESAKSAILRALPHVSDLQVTKDRQVVVTEGSARVPLERLSDGYRGTLAWVGDLIRRLFDAYPNSLDPLKEHGVVLVDEIDLHLHPRWQRSVVEDIRQLFPNLQFIVTTHSPFVAQDMRSQDRIVVLERSGRDRRGPVVAREEPGVLQDWSADQILAAYFGLSRGTRGEEALRIEARYERLLDAEATGMLTDTQRTELQHLRTRVDRIPIGTTPDEQAFERAADNVVTALRQRRLELEAERHSSETANAPSNGSGSGD